MSTIASRILDEALTLSEDARTEMAMKLLESLDAYDPHAHLTDDELRAEIHARADGAASGRDKGIPWPDVLRRLEEKAGR
jgi:putative addiction module component (TIGR02574 family)